MEFLHLLLDIFTLARTSLLFPYRIPYRPALRIRSSVPALSMAEVGVSHLPLGMFAVLRAVSTLSLAIPSSAYLNTTRRRSLVLQESSASTDRILDGCPGGSFCLINGRCCPDVGFSYRYIIDSLGFPSLGVKGGSSESRTVPITRPPFQC